MNLSNVFLVQFPNIIIIIIIINNNNNYRRFPEPYGCCRMSRGMSTSYAVKVPCSRTRRMLRFILRFPICLHRVHRNAVPYYGGSYHQCLAFSMFNAHDVRCFGNCVARTVVFLFSVGFYPTTGCTERLLYLNYLRALLSGIIVKVYRKEGIIKSVYN